MTYTITVVFPNETDAQYDIDYYTNVHMRLIEKHWSKYGLKSWSVTKFGPSLDGTAPVYAVGSRVHWESEEGMKRAFESPEVAEVMGDVVHFSNKQPIFLFGETECFFSDSARYPSYERASAPSFTFPISLRLA
ncbi:uncharacterized protein BO96DRAFT_492378 [Aspergillus niger CBS 101883]|uniref:Contig An14c0120, genomic contig n=2 Tax=Aspergillus niger TaxID=5061 RepID=A2R330_ASPNC|nr:uncharacterized protein An14g02850 [Aspergillus niger]XP_025456650.1 uncharacterized protein BO96DRAFT_492378 [Aspergillus niger CBS 101883]PYH58595.1 hypothetical protein BO96DRAFT_492378 [Aspergillus niger CBS 101883]CAK41996.1 unnamed protein product [Aspergillus niger]